MSRLYQTFRERFREAVKADGRPATKLARRSGYSVYHIRATLRGEKNNTTLACVEVMAETLKVDVAWLLGLDGPKDEPQ